MSRSLVFLDTSHIYAVLNVNVQWHGRAVDRQRQIDRTSTNLVTTDLILVEIADGLSSVKFRAAAIRTIELLRGSPRVEVVPFGEDLFDRGFALFMARQDKGWGLADCTSFLVMEDLGIADALTADDHFRQAGFNALLIDP